MITTKANSFEKYIDMFPKDIQILLGAIRESIYKAAPEAEESISYRLPAYKFCGRPLVYFAAYKNNIGFYATPAGHKEFQKDLSIYKQGKGSVRFPLDKPIPYALISKILRFKVKENHEKLTLKNNKVKSS